MKISLYHFQGQGRVPVFLGHKATLNHLPDLNPIMILIEETLKDTKITKN